MWKGIITQISEVDSGGNVTVSFDIVNDKGAVKYLNMQTTGRPEGIEQSISTIVANLKNQTQQAKLLTVGQEITVN